MSDSSGVVFPVDASSGRRSTTAVGRAVVAEALRAADPVGSASAARETNWRQGYLPALPSPRRGGPSQSEDAAVTIARDGLASLHDRMRWVGLAGEDRPLGTSVSTSSPATELSPRRSAVRPPPTAPSRCRMPVSGFRGRAPSRAWPRGSRPARSSRRCAEAVERVMANPDWLDLSDRTVVVLGAAAEMGPLRTLLRWGADVAAVDLPRKDLWERLIGETRRSCRLDHGAGHGRRRHAVGRAARWRPRARPRRRDPVGRAPRGAARPRQLRLCRRGDQRARVSAAVDALTPRVIETTRSRRRGPGLPRHARPTSSPCPASAVATVGRPTTPSGIRARCCACPCAPSPVGGCSAATTSPAGRRRASTTASCCSRGPTTFSPSGSSGGGRRHTAPTAGWCRSRSRRRRAPARSSRTARSRRPTPARTASASRSSSRAPPTRSWQPCSSTTCAPARRRSRTPGRTRRMPRCTVGCGRRPTTRAAPSGSPPCSASPPRS